MNKIMIAGGLHNQQFNSQEDVTHRRTQSGLCPTEEHLPLCVGGCFA